MTAAHEDAANAPMVNSGSDREPQIVTLRPSSEHSRAAKARRFIKRRLQILNWIGDYNAEWAASDCIAGLTLGLTIIPESIACALLAGLPVHHGLCSAFVGAFVYLIFGSVDTVIIGPTSLVALVSVQFTLGKPIEFAYLLTLLSGVVQLIMGTLRMGFIFEFISMPVIKAFSSATAVLVIESQLKVLLGIRYLVAGFVQSTQTLASRIREANTGDLLMGLSAMVFLFAFEQLERLARRPQMNRATRVCCRYLSFSRNTLIVLITAGVAYVWLQRETSVPFTLSRNTLVGLPNFTFPALTVQTPDRTYSFWDVLVELNVGVLVIPIIGLMTNISIGKLTPKGLVDTNQELLSNGLCNVVGSCVQSMPVSGAFTRHAISTACGLKTPMANLYSGAIVLLALSYLSPYFSYIPEATLAAILVCAIVTLLDFRLPVRLWRESKRDFLTWLLCFVGCILCGVEVGLFVATLLTALHLLYLWARPEMAVKIEEIDSMQYISVTPGNAIYFPAVNRLREKVLEACTRADFQIPVVISCHKVTGLDYTAAQGISKLSADLGAADNGGGALLILYRMPPEWQKLVDTAENLVFCEREEKLREFLTQESLRSGHINLKDHIRASIDLGYKIDID